jgi:hypothetical protein
MLSVIAAYPQMERERWTRTTARVKELLADRGLNMTEAIRAAFPKRNVELWRRQLAALNIDGDTFGAQTAPTEPEAVATTEAATQSVAHPIRALRRSARDGEASRSVNDPAPASASSENTTNVGRLRLRREQLSKDDGEASAHRPKRERRSGSDQ